MTDSAVPRYTVKQVSAITGVLATTLRVWERRYGVVKPERSQGGYRLYTPEQVEMLRRMAALVEGGMAASLAARTIASGSPPDAGDAATLGRLDLVAAAMSLDPASLDAVLASAFAAAPLDVVCQAWLMPELERLGAAWAQGELTVAHEHFASAGVLRALGRRFDEARPTEPGRVLVGLPPGSHHQLGLFAFATCLRQRGVDVVYLGADVPVADWERAATSLAPRAAVLGVPRASRTPRAQEVVNRLRAFSPPILVWVGGGRAGRLPGAARLPDDVGVAAQEVAQSLRARDTG